MLKLDVINKLPYGELFDVNIKRVNDKECILWKYRDYFSGEDELSYFCIETGNKIYTIKMNNM